MEKLFTPGKWFVGFCAIFVCIFMVRNYVHDEKIKELSKIAAQDIFEWQWPAKRIASSCDITDAQIVKADKNSATVTVKGVQKIAPMADFTADGQNGSEATATSPSQTTNTGASTTSDCQALIKLYRQDNRWQLGSVEVQ